MPTKSRPLLEIDRLYRRGLTLLSKEMSRLETLTIAEKLSAGHSKDLRDYIKLLGEMKEAHEAIDAERKKRKKQNNNGPTDEEIKAALTDEVK